MRGRSSAGTLLAVSLIASAWIACSSSSTTEPLQAGSTPSVSIGDDFFSPKVDTVAVGTTVTWTNNGGIAHTTTSDTGIWDSGSKGKNQTFTHQFTQAGEFPYHCTFHGAPGTGMSGRIVVK